MDLLANKLDVREKINTESIYVFADVTASSIVNDYEEFLVMYSNVWKLLLSDSDSCCYRRSWNSDRSVRFEDKSPVDLKREYLRSERDEGIAVCRTFEQVLL